MRRTFHGDHGSHRGPVGWIGGPGVEQAMKGVVGGVSREVIVVACMVITGSTSMVTERTNDREMMSLPGEKRQVFA